MEERKGDARIYIISGFFFICVVSGGILLGLYIFLYDQFSSSYYAVAGLILVGVPWIYWSLAYLYKCFSPSKNNDKRNFITGNIVNPVKRANVVVASSSATSPKQAAASSPQTKPTSPTKVSPPGEEDCSDNGRRVHFGEVIVVGNEDDNKESVNDVENGQTAIRERHWRMISESLEESDSNINNPNDNKDSVDKKGIEMALPLL